MMPNITPVRKLHTAIQLGGKLAGAPEERGSPRHPGCVLRHYGKALIQTQLSSNAARPRCVACCLGFDHGAWKCCRLSAQHHAASERV